MQTKSWMTTAVIVAGFVLSACQSTLETSVIDRKLYIPPKVLIEPLADTDNDGVPDKLDNCPNTPEGIKVDPYGCPVAVNLMGPLVIDIRVYFTSDSLTLTNEAYLTEIQKVAEKTRNHPNLVTILSGHISKAEAENPLSDIDNKATDAKSNNSHLARNRVQLVKGYLVEQGIAADKVLAFDCVDKIQLGVNNEGANIETEKHAAEISLLNQRVFGAVIEASKAYSSNYPDELHSLKHYKEVCQQL